MTMAKTVAIGEQDFSKIIENNYFYIDKTYFIKDWWENGDTVTLITRPRRFGKTLTMSMLDCFFSIHHVSRRHLFQNLYIGQQAEYKQLQGTFPVIFLSFANVKADNYETAREGMFQELVDVYDRNAFLLDSDRLTAREKELFQKIKEDMSDMTAARSLLRLSNLLYKHYGKRVLIFMDEYDTPMQEAYVNDYWHPLSEFMKKLMNSTFKTNPALERGMLTGITRVGKESVFSDLNNLAVVTTTTKLYESAFGFTEKEVCHALTEFQLEDKYAQVTRWYDGFRFGTQDHMYNPWSIINFLKFQEFSAYWTNTSSNRLIGSLIQSAGAPVKMVMADLMRGHCFHTSIDEQIVFDDLARNEHAIWSLLLAIGYLKAADYEINVNGKKDYALTIVNFEVRQMFGDLFLSWFSACSYDYNDFIKALLRNEIESMNHYMERIVRTVISSFDAGTKPSEQSQPEKFYHGFVLGLMISLTDRYVITSNRESGFGRSDTLLEPKNHLDDGIIFEFKVLDSRKEKDLEDTANAAIRQIIRKKYAAALETACKKERIRIYGFAFRGKELLIKGGYLKEWEAENVPLTL